MPKIILPETPQIQSPLEETIWKTWWKKENDNETETIPDTEGDMSILQQSIHDEN